MNIFVTDPNPYISARDLDDLRVNKMILESAQLLSGAIRSYGISHKWLYNETHMSHPVSIWTRQSQENFDWLVSHARALIIVREVATGKSHACKSVIEACAKYTNMFPKKVGLTPFQNCTDFKDYPVHKAYKMALNAKWQNSIRNQASRFHPTWKNRSMPEWRNLLGETIIMSKEDAELSAKM